MLLSSCLLVLFFVFLSFPLLVALIQTVFLLLFLFVVRRASILVVDFRFLSSITISVSLPSPLNLFSHSLVLLSFCNPVRSLFSFCSPLCGHILSLLVPSSAHTMCPADINPLLITFLFKAIFPVNLLLSQLSHSLREYSPLPRLFSPRYFCRLVLFFQSLPWFLGHIV